MCIMKITNKRTPNIASFYAVRCKLQYCCSVAKQSFRQCAKCFEGECWTVASPDLDFHPTLRGYQSLRRDINGPGTYTVLSPELTGHSHGVPQGKGCFDRLSERHPADFDAWKQPTVEIKFIIFLVENHNYWFINVIILLNNYISLLSKSLYCVLLYSSTSYCNNLDWSILPIAVIFIVFIEKIGGIDVYRYSAFRISMLLQTSLLSLPRQPLVFLANLLRRFCTLHNFPSFRL